MARALHRRVRRAVAILCAAAVACAWPSTGAAQPLPPEGQAAIAAGDYKSAIEKIKPAVTGEPTGACAYWLGVAYGETGNEKEATKLLGAMFDADPHDAAVCQAALRYCSIFWLRQRGPEKFPLALIDPDIAKALVMARCRVIKAAKESDGSGAALLALLTANSALSTFDAYRDMTDAFDPELWRWAGFCQLQRGGYAEAAALLSRAVVALPDAWDSRLDLALALLRAGRHDDAAIQFARALELAPKQASDERGGASRRTACRVAWGQALQAVGRSAEAATVYRDLLNEQPSFNGARHMLGSAAYDSGDMPLAMWAFTDSIDLDGVTESSTALGRCWYDLGEFGAALACFERAAASYKSNEARVPAELEHYLGRALWGLDRKADALPHLDKACTLEDDNMLYARWAFQAYIAADDPYGAIEVCRRMGFRKDVDEAIAGIEEVLRRWPTPRPADFAAKKPQSHVRVATNALIDIRWAQGRVREAAEYIRGRRMHVGPGVHASAPWVLLLAGDAETAETSAKAVQVVFRTDEYWSDYARLAQAAALLKLAKPAEALTAIAPVKSKQNALRRAVLQYYASSAAGAPDAASADAWTALGVLEFRLLNDTAGVEILTLLPGSPLESADVPILPRDRIQKIEGLGYIGSDKSIERVRAAELPARSVEITILRRGESIVATVDLAPAAAKLAAAKAAGRKDKP